MKVCIIVTVVAFVSFLKNWREENQFHLSSLVGSNVHAENVQTWNSRPKALWSRQLNWSGTFSPEVIDAAVILYNVYESDIATGMGVQSKNGAAGQSRDHKQTG
ncbi:hypothetical protein Tco_0324863 [Tanacetum coccineum]